MIPSGGAPPESYGLVDKYGISSGYSNTAGRVVVGDPLDSTKQNAVILLLGQSQSANHGAGLYTAQNPTKVHNLNVFDGVVYQAMEPILGPTFTLPSYGTFGAYGSYSTVLGDTLIAAGYDRVVITNISIGGIPAYDYTPPGPYNHWLHVALKRMRGRGMLPTHVLWHQGETDGLILGTPQATYEAELRTIFAVIRGYCGAKILVPKATWLNPAVYNPNTSDAIRAAQEAVVDNAAGIYAGPDFDTLGAEWRDDGLHFGNISGGQTVVAEMWRDAIMAAGG